jgi:hypothetical protein
MAAARLAAVLLAALAAQLAGQQASQTGLTIEVLDPNGAVIPGAHVEIEGLASEASNMRRQAKIYLPPGVYDLGLFSGLQEIGPEGQGRGLWSGANNRRDAVRRIKRRPSHDRPDNPT